MPLIVTLLMAGAASTLHAEQVVGKEQETIREIFVPFEDVSVLLEDQPRRVLLTRAEYETLLRKARKAPEDRAPHAVVKTSADYSVLVGQGRAEITGTMELEVVEEGLHAIALDFDGAGLRGAALDGRSAAIGRDGQGGLTLFVEGRGRHELVLDRVAPVETTAALQTLTFQVPAVSVARMRLAVPGDVEVKSGADVVSRVFDELAEVTRFELLPKPGKVSLVMTLNNRLLQSRRIVVARSVIVDEITESYERLHATFSMAVLHRPVDCFRFAVPSGFEITNVKSPLLSHWAVNNAGERKTLEIRLREPAIESVVIMLSAVSAVNEASLENWALPELEPLDVVGQTAMVGLLLGDRLKLESLKSNKLIPIDTSVLTGAFPATVFRAQPGVSRLRAVAAFYAPMGTGGFDATARFQKPPGGLRVTTNLLLTLTDDSLRARSGFALKPEVEKIFSVDLSVPALWHIVSVTDVAGKALRFEVTGDDGGEQGQASRVRVRLPGGIAPGNEQAIYVQAVHTPTGWLSDWKSTSVVFPVFAVHGATRDVGAIEVSGSDEMTVYPDTLERLTPLDEDEKGDYGVTAPSVSGVTLAYRYEAHPYNASFRVERVAPRLTARTYSFIRLEPELLRAHFEIVYDVEEARTNRLALLLPATTPAEVSIRALDGVSVKEHESDEVGDMRRWTVLLADRRRDTIRLTIDFEQGLDESDPGTPVELDLPIVRADGVAYQSGVVAVKGDAELDVQVISHPRKVDVGELVGATYQPDRSAMGGLGVFGFVGDKPEVKVRLSRPSGHPTPPAIVQRAEMVTLLSADGLSQTAARLQLRTRASFLEIELPEGSELWSAELDGKPAKPQRAGGRLLLSLHARTTAGLRDLRIVYETPVDDVAFWSDVEMFAPKFAVRMDGEKAPAFDVPIADVNWRLHLPVGFEIVRYGGTVATDELQPPEPAAWPVAGILYKLTGGVNPFFWMPTLSRAREHAHVLSHPQGTVVSSGDDDFDRLKTLGYLGAGKETETSKELEAGASVQQAQEPSDLAGEELQKYPAPGKAGKRDTDMAYGYWAMEGVRSLSIELERSGAAVTFQSLGVEPRLSVTLAHWRRVKSLAWGLAMAVGLIGVALTPRSVRTKALYLITVALVTTLIPLLTGRPELAHLTNPVFYLVSLLLPFYVVARFAERLTKKVRRRLTLPVSATVVMALVFVSPSAAQADQPGTEDNPVVVRVVEPSKPIEFPEDAVIVPYDPESESGIKPTAGQDDQLLVPYDKFVELWNLAYPEEPVGFSDLPVAYALAGAAFTAALEGDEHLNIEGHIDIDVYTDEPVTVPLELGGGVLARAELDGVPARLSVAGFDVEPRSLTLQREIDGCDASRLTLRVDGRSRHRLDLTVRMRITRRGGWRVVEGRLPAAPATALTLRVPQAGTEVRLGDVRDRRGYETKQPAEVIKTALGAEGSFNAKWRPKVHEGHVDPSLTATSEALLDLREDGLHLIWKLDLDVGRTERETFNILVPGDYLVEKVEGANVRGWIVREDDEAAPQDRGSSEASDRNERRLDVSLLKPTRGGESFTLILHRRASVMEGELAEFEVPVVRVFGAALHNGQLTIRRSPLLRLRTTRTSGVTRTDTPEDGNKLTSLAENNRESPLGIRAYQAYRFAATPFTVGLAVEVRRGKPRVEVQAVLRVGEWQRCLDSRIKVTPSGNPVHQVRIAVPDDLRVEHVSAPGAFEWSITEENERKILTVYLGNGQRKKFPILVRGLLGGEYEVVESVALPRLEVLDAGYQSGDIAVQVDPAFDVQAVDLRNCREIVLRRLNAWLTGEQRRLARLALHYNSPDYGGVLRLSLRKPEVACSTITNVRITERAVEETVLLDFTISKAGIRSIAFVLPCWMSDSRITVPMLRRKTVEPVSDEPQAPVRVCLWLQDDVMGRLRVLVENDRLLTPEVHRVPIPVVETGRTDRRCVALESAGRDEVVIEKLVGLEVLTHRQKEWKTLADILGDGITRAYIAGAEDPLLTFKTTERVAVETVGARIGLAQAILVVDANGAYRAAQSYRIDNTTEQFLEIELPEGAGLWSALVASKPVKPASVAKSRNVRIPLVKTATGDLDYQVLLKYGGQLPTPGSLRAIDFPLMRTINVSVELSQVSLFLPEDHRWFDFDGTMRRLRAGGDLAAGYVRYQTRQADRLVQTMQGESAFARVRAAQSFKDLKSQLDQFQQSKSSRNRNMNLRQELIVNQNAVNRAEEQLQKLAQEPQLREVTDDNRSRLNEFYGNQKTKRARNTVQGLPGNFDYPAAQEQKKQSKIGQQIDRSVRAQPQAPNVVQEELRGKLGRSTGDGDKRRGAAKGRKRRATTNELVTQYQQQLQARSQVAPVEKQEREGDSHSLTDDEMGLVVPQVAPRVPPADKATGLASLSIELPVRGLAYHFTTPRGEVTITARAVSCRFIETVKRVMVVLLAVVIGVLFYRLILKERLHKQLGPERSTAMIVLGIVSILCGLFPVIGLAAVVVGAGRKIGLHFDQGD